MTHLAVQRVIVRMLYDARFAARVYTEPSKAMADCDLDDRERAWLLQPDRRAYRVDPLRRSRSLAGLLEEFPVAAALHVRASSDATALDLFFSSPVFHEGMQRGASLAALFGIWLEGGASDDWARQAAQLEGAMAEARREGERRMGPRPRPGEAVLAPGVALHELPSGGLASYGAQLEVLRSHPRGAVEAIVDPGCALPASATRPQPAASGLALEASDHEGLLIDARRAELRLEPLSVELCAVLRLLTVPLTFEELVELAAAHGADATDCRGIVEGFAEDGVLGTG